MALIEINANLDRTAAALERIADALELLVNFQVDPPTVRLHRMSTREYSPPDPDTQLTVVTDEALWQREREQEELKLAQAGLPSQEMEE